MFKNKTTKITITEEPLSIPNADQKLMDMHICITYGAERHIIEIGEQKPFWATKEQLMFLAEQIAEVFTS